jgi:hypothetical protein
MRLTKKLLSFLHRVFDKDPTPFLALRLSYGGTSMTWAVSDAVLKTTVAGGPGANLSVDLKQYTIAGLVAYLAAQPGYSVLYADTSDLSKLSARVLLDASGDISQSNGDHLYGYTSVLWSYLEASANELANAKAQVDEAIKQITTVTASGEWLDELGGYYGVPRLQGELDDQYGPRIIAEVLRPRANNVAMEAAISAYTGQSTTVTDVTLYTLSPPIYNGLYNYDGTQHHNSASVPRYGLFDVQYAYDLIGGGDITDFQQVVHDLINRLRDAGTQLRSLSLVGSTIFDTLTAPTDSMPGMAVSIPLDDALTAPTETTSIATNLDLGSDTLSAPTDDETITISYSTTYNGLRTHDGSVPYSSGSSIPETL